MKIKMLRSKLGSNDGISTKLYQVDEEHDVSDALGEVFIKEGVAELGASGEKADTAPKNKAVAKAPENKSE